jgi:hypothetical protein
VLGGANQPLDLELHQALQHQLGQVLQKITAAALLQQLQECHSLFGHRVFSFGWRRGVATKPYRRSTMTT